MLIITGSGLDGAIAALGPSNLCLSEVESHLKINRAIDRPALDKALAPCRVHGATLVIAKLDRLARNVNFISNLMEAGVEFTAVDFPQPNRLTIHIRAAVAEHEAVMISSRTKAALAAAKARGIRLADPTSQIGTRAYDGAQASLAVRRAKAAKRFADLLLIVREIQASGAESLRQIAAVVNTRGIAGPRGGEWSAVQVRRVLAG
jgi:DNA invertase Pin-like site-specific DNA recombinase